MRKLLTTTITLLFFTNFCYSQNNLISMDKTYLVSVDTSDQQSNDQQWNARLNSLKQSLATDLTFFMLEKGLTSEDLSKKINGELTAEDINLIKEGRSVPTIMNLMKICIALDVDFYTSDNFFRLINN